MGRRAATGAGIITGIRFATKSLEPSLMRRSAIDQGLIMGGSFLTGFVSGSLAGRLLEVLPLPRSGLGVRILGFAAASAQSAQVLNTRDPNSPPPVDEREAWGEAGAEIMSALALTGLGGKHLPAATVTTVSAVVAATALEGKSALDRRQDAPDLRYLATATGVAAGLNLAVAGLAASVVGGAKLAARVAPTNRIARSAAGLAGGIAVAAAISAAGRFGVRTMLARIAAGNRATEISYADPPDATSVSGNRYSLAPYGTLGVQGRRLVSEFTHLEDIEAVMGEPARTTPVRVYVGLGSADTEDDRIELAIQEMRRAGGFERSLIIAASPAGTGYVNYITVEAAELMARGDVATVAVQYGEVPSMLSITKVGDAARVYARLVARLRTEIDATGRPIRLAAYGESLGSITCQIGVREASQGREGLVVDHALWVGTPQGSKLFAELTAEGVPVFDQFEDVRAYLAAGNPVPPVLLLNHDNDPVTKFTPTLAYRMPDWLRTVERGRNMDPHQRWLPGIAFWQALIDTKNAATVVPGEFFSTGHDYRADLAEFVRLAYGFDDVSDSQMGAIEARLRRSEVARADQIAVGRVQSA
jgi:uncharacterized membrane protein